MAGRIVFPYLDSRGVCYDIRGRLFDDEDGEKYLSPYGPTVFRGAIIPYNYTAATADKVIVAEAEIKADIAAQHGFDVIGLPGMGKWKKAITQGDNQQFVICYDNQRNGRRELVRMIKSTAMHLEPELTWVATLPLDSRDKQEIDTYINEYGAEAFAKVIKRAVPYKTWEKIIRAY
jgi:DNA primase